MRSGAEISSFTYTQINSDRGQSDSYTNVTQWSGSDVGINTDKYPGPPTLVALPSVAGAIAVSAYLPELQSVASPSNPMRLSRAVLPLIIRNEIQSWNDTRIQDCQSDANIRVALSKITRNILPIVRSAGSGTTQNFLRALRSMDPNFPTNANISGIVGPSSIVAVSNSAVGSILSSIPYTLTYIDARELQIAEQNGKVLTPIAIENKNGEYVLPSADSIKKALTDVDARTVDVTKGNAIAIDSAVPGAYPISLITNFVIRKDAISDDIDVTMWTLRFMWWVHTANVSLRAPDEDRHLYQPEFQLRNVTESKNFVQLSNSSASELTLNFLRNYKHKGAVLFKQSICDLNPGEPSPCKNNGFCQTNNLPFQPSSVACMCVNGFINREFNDCSERAPIFAQDAITYIQLSGAALAAIVIAVIWTLLLLYSRHHVIRPLAPSCCNLILLGCAFGALSVLGYSATPGDAVCRLRVFFPNLAFGLVFGMMMLKTYRIYLIFGYRHISAARSIRNWTLIQLTLVIALIEIGLCFIYVFLTEPSLSQVYFTDRTNSSSSRSNGSSYLTCKAKDSKGYLSQIMEAVLFTFNGGIMFICLFLAFKTRGAYKRYVESKAIGLTTYVVALSLLISLPVIYAIPIESAKTNLVIVAVRGGLLIVLSIAVPILLFAPRIFEAIENKRDEEDDEPKPAKRSGGSGYARGPGAKMVPEGATEYQTSSSGSPTETWNIQASMFDCGFRRDRFASVWQSAVLLVLPELDLMYLMDSIKEGRTYHSFRISTSELEGIVRSESPLKMLTKSEPRRRHHTKDIKSKLGDDWGEDEDSHEMQPQSRQRQNSSASSTDIHAYGAEMYNSPETGSTISGGGQKMVVVIPKGERKGFFIEFASEDRLKAFHNVFEVVRARALGVSPLGERIYSRSLRLNNSPIIHVVKGANANGDGTTLGGSPMVMSESQSSLAATGKNFSPSSLKPLPLTTTNSKTIALPPSSYSTNYSTNLSSSFGSNMGTIPKTVSSVLDLPVATSPTSTTFMASRRDPSSIAVSTSARSGNMSPGSAGGFVIPPPSLPAWALGGLNDPQSVPAVGGPRQAHVRRKSEGTISQGPAAYSVIRQGQGRGQVLQAEEQQRTDRPMPPPILARSSSMSKIMSDFTQNGGEASYEAFKASAESSGGAGGISTGGSNLGTLNPATRPEW
ncbi:hypothetical protein HDU97_008622 [Phlyctochytrium planicorne]|nr:hypothetical protein HDU97_008622 [Phlyctochytrium planicorne]